MFSKTTIALCAVFFVGTASVTLAETADPNPNDRHPGPVASSMTHVAAPMAQVGTWHAVRTFTPAEKAAFERASQPSII